MTDTGKGWLAGDHFAVIGNPVHVHADMDSPIFRAEMELHLAGLSRFVFDEADGTAVRVDMNGGDDERLF